MEMQNIGIETEKKQRQIELYRDLFVGYLLFIYLFFKQQQYRTHNNPQILP